MRRGSTIYEVLAALASIVVLGTLAVPAMTAKTCDDLKNVSIRNLQALHFAHVMYAADWNDRQVTWARDDLGAWDGDAVAYNEAHDCADPFDPGCQPPVVAGLDCDGILHSYDLPQQAWAIQPINFPGPPYGAVTWVGSFRFPNARPFHDYLNGRVQDPVFYAPKDDTVLDQVAGCLDSECEFDPACNPGWSSYCLSPAAMLHPDVLAWNDDWDIYWRPPWDFDEGYESPTVSQAQYPALKTWMLEHSWLQNPPVPCNPSFPGCEPYYFNQGYYSVPMTLFYDGHVNGLSPYEAMRAEARTLAQAEQFLWSRDTPFGDEGYFILDGSDATETAFHILTIDGIRGRDTVFQE